MPTSNAPSGTALTSLISGGNANVAAGTPREIYQRIARQASNCWFGPFGSAHHLYMTSADVPPPSSSAAVTMVVHRRLKDLKKPWGPALLRIELNGSATTTIAYQNVGLDLSTFSRMTNGFNGWANNNSGCPTLHDAEPQWAPLPASTMPQPASRRR